MSDLLTDIRSDISARLEELRPAVTEYTRLEEALAALTGASSTARRRRYGRSTYARSAGNSGPPDSRRRNARSASSPSGTAARGRSKQPTRGRGRPRTKRAARGANQAAVVAALREHGPATVPELAAATKIKPGVLYALTRVLVDKGVLSAEKTNGKRAFTLAE
jgi:hypothetical protein